MLKSEKYESWENFFTELLITLTADGVERYSKKCAECVLLARMDN